MPCIETLPFLLKSLKLPAIANHWQERVSMAEKNHMSYGNFLADVMDLEFTLREQKKLERAYKNAKLPIGKTLANFNFDTTTSVNAANITRMAQDRQWVDDAQNLILLGPSGVGKTHMAAAIGYGLLELGVKVYFSSTTLLVQMLQQAKAELKLKSALERLAKYQILILDDIGYVKKSEQETSVLFELIAHRYESGSLLITANQPFGDWEILFPDKIMAVAAVDRIVHHATIIKVDGSSYRANYAKQQNKENI
ncbi:MAG: ATP-binding protein [Pseudomonadota bacterium]|nr:ATP-binding protein [Pseudomonadota bacterium]